MNNQARHALVNLIASFGTSLIGQPQRLRSLLNDECPGLKREITVLILALEQKVPAELQTSSAGSPWVILSGRLVKQLKDDAAIAEDAARWAVESWALALGRVDASVLQPAMGVLAPGKGSSPVLPSQPSNKADKSTRVVNPHGAAATRPMEASPVENALSHIPHRFFKGMWWFWLGISCVGLVLFMVFSGKSDSASHAETRSAGNKAREVNSLLVRKWNIADSPTLFGDTHVEFTNQGQVIRTYYRRIIGDEVTHYRYQITDDGQLYSDPSINLKLVKLTSSELVLSWNGTVAHYKRGWYWWEIVLAVLGVIVVVIVCAIVKLAIDNA